MAVITEQFVEALLTDLRRFSPVLLDAGLAPSSNYRGRPSDGSLSGLLSHVEAFASLVPRLLAELEEQPSFAREETVVTAVPRGARASRCPADYMLRDERLVPVSFMSTRSVVEKDTRSLGWLLWLTHRFEEVLDRATGRLHKHIRHELAGRRDYTWSFRQENDSLRELESSLDEALARLSRAQHRVLAEARYNLKPSSQPPRPYPMTAAFTSLRLLAHELMSPESALPRLLRSMLDGVGVADLPFLYQRWCGVKVIGMLESMGWHSLDDPLPPIFLGGRIRWIKEQDNGVAPGELALWCEPHLTLQGRHQSGLYSLHREASPDFVFLVPGPRGQDAFVLDPTLSSDVSVRREKSRYLTDLAFDSLQLVAGVPALHQPRRSWAAAPIRAPRCELLDLEGRSGTVPMHPEEFVADALRGWLEDVEAYALGWGKIQY